MMQRDLFEIAKTAFQKGNYAKAKFIFDYALNPLIANPLSKQDSLPWIEYASTCQMIGYYNEAERVYKMCDELGFYQDFVRTEISKTVIRKSKQHIPKIICNNDRLQHILGSIVSCFPRIKKDILTFVAQNQDEVDDFLVHQADFKKSYTLSDYSELACGFYDNPDKFVLVFSKKFFEVFKTDSEMIGCCAHELAHFSIVSGMTIPEICYYLDVEIQHKVNTVLYDEKYMSGDGDHMANNEYIVDAAAISCGFAHDLSAAWRAWRIYKSGLSDKLIAPEVIDRIWHIV